MTLISDGWGSQGWWLVVGGPVRRLLNTGARYRLGRKGLVPRDVVHHEIAPTYFGCSDVFHIVGYRWSNTSGYVHFASRIYPRCSWLG